MRPVSGRPGPTQRRWLLWLGLIVSIGVITIMGTGNPAWAGPSEAQTVPTLTKSPTPGPSPTVTSAASATPPATATPSPVPPTSTSTPGSVRPTPTPAGPTPTRAPEANVCADDARALGAARVGGPWSLGLRAARIWLFAWPGAAGEGIPCRIALTLVSSGALPAPAAGLRLASVGARLTPLDIDGRVVAVETRALMVCFQRPAAPPPVSSWSVAVVNTASSAGGWDRLVTRVVGGAACGVTNRLPATFALLAGN